MQWESDGGFYPLEYGGLRPLECDQVGSESYLTFRGDENRRRSASDVQRTPIGSAGLP